ncbi:hypothetical protein SLOPH_453, partial [Spraguea lophii 42_110]
MSIISQCILFYYDTSNEQNTPILQNMLLKILVHFPSDPHIFKNNKLLIYTTNIAESKLTEIVSKDIKYLILKNINTNDIGDIKNSDNKSDNKSIDDINNTDTKNIDNITENNILSEVENDNTWFKPTEQIIVQCNNRIAVYQNNNICHTYNTARNLIKSNSGRYLAFTMKESALQ